MLWQKGEEFKANLGYIVRPNLKANKQKITNKQKIKECNRNLFPKS
jgi:hypothetical protein